MLELGCGTGRIAVPLARAGVPLVGIDRSDADARRGRAQRLRRAAAAADACASCAATSARCRSAAASRSACVMAPYGILQSLTRERDLSADARRRSPRVLRPGGTVRRSISCPTCRDWREYRAPRSACAAAPRPAAHLTLVESVRQDRARGLTIFDQEYIERRGRRPPRRTVRADVPHAVGAADDPPPRTRRLRASTPCSATTRAARGTRAPTSGSSWRAKR